MKITIVLILIILMNFQPSIYKSNVAIHNLYSSHSIDSSIKFNIKYPLAVEYTNNSNSDTIFVYLGNERLLITPKGIVFKNSEIFFNILPEGNIQKIFPFIIGSDIILIYSYSTINNDSGSCAKRISLIRKNILWETSIYGFKLVTPILIDDYVYLSTIGFVGKMNITNGKFIWEFDVFFKNGNFISFNEPVFFKDSMVLFTEKDPVNAIACSILIDDRNSRVLKIQKEMAGEIFSLNKEQ